MKTDAVFGVGDASHKFFPRDAFLMPNHPQQDVCCLMGEPVAGNPTQYMLEKAFAVADLDWRFLTFEVSAVDFEAALRGVRIFEFSGVMLAPPHRGEVQQFLESVTDAARLSGQVNCLQLQKGQLRGHNTEGLALRRLVESKLPLKGLQATILGAGRLAKSVAAELALGGAAEIELVCQDGAEADSLIESLKQEPRTAAVVCRTSPWPTAGAVPAAAECRLLVNATPLGSVESTGQPPIEADRLSPDTLVVDAAFNPPNTRLVRDARARGLHAIDGLTMLVEQAAIAFEIWTGQKPDREAMREAVEEFLVL